MTLKKQVYQKNACFAIFGILKMDINLNHKFVINVTAYEFKNIAILNLKGVDFRFILWDIIALGL